MEVMRLGARDYKVTGVVVPSKHVLREANMLR